LTVICTTNAPNGYTAGVNGPATNGVTIFVQNATTVGGGTADPLLSVGTQSAINNEGTITAIAGGTAASLGGGSKTRAQRNRSSKAAHCVWRPHVNPLQPRLILE